ncbi:MAG TPA: hypothetical protein VEK15_10450, partial [Vicinamibacteria bacterium]|nr:hypothetical protein [Vicinamibacteria bacterium]
NRYYYIEAFTSPSYALRRWDELLTRGPVVGFYAANAHGGFAITDETTVPLPSYETAFTYAGLGISPAHRDSPEEAIRRGEFFSLVRAAGEPQKFEITRDGDRIRVVVQTASLSPRIDLKRNGIVVASAESAELAMDAKTPGVYRAEVYLPEHPLLSPEVPWILSNPLFVGVEFSPARAHESSCTSFTPLPLEDVTLEKDDESTGSLTSRESGELELDYELSRATPKKIDRWVALALRRRIDLSRFKAIYLEAESGDAMRYWLELRAGERGHYASFKLKPGVVNRITLPWSRFYSTTGVRSIPKLWELDALFVTVNTSNSRTGFRSQMTLKTLGGCE